MTTIYFTIVCIDGNVNISHDIANKIPFFKEHLANSSGKPMLVEFSKKVILDIVEDVLCEHYGDNHDTEQQAREFLGLE